MPNYSQNMYQWLKRNGYAQQYEHAGIYQITIDGKTVYIGKSTDMLWRLAQHCSAMKLSKAHKYQVLREAKQHGHTVSFSVVYYARSTQKPDVVNEIGAVEGEYIRKYRPLLNEQIPCADDWRKYENNPAAASVTLEELLKSKPDKYSHF